MYDLIIIGAGPAGISMAVEARTAGIDASKILVLEKAGEHSFTLKKFYPETKLVTARYKGFDAVCTGVMCMPDLSKQETISYLDSMLQSHAIQVRYHQTVHRIFKHEGEQHFTVFTEEEGFETRVVVIAIGILGKPNKPDYPLPRTLRNRLLFEIAAAPFTRQQVLVVGGGDTASEYCQYLVQHDNRVALSYRRSEFQRMNEINRRSLLMLAERGAVRLLLNSEIERVVDKGGKPEVHFAGAEREHMLFDYVVYALGGSTPENFLKAIGIEFNGDAPALKEAYETSVPGMFLVGDLSAGEQGGSIIWAFNSTNTAMRKICREYLGCGKRDAITQ